MLKTRINATAAFPERQARKRKRETYAIEGNGVQPPLCLKGETKLQAAAANASCFTNAAYSSTPKKSSGRRSIAKENANPFLPTTEAVQLNPFEVTRHTHKKKKFENACFENPGLNLELPEKQFNPYEVMRIVASSPIRSKGFINEALNLRGNDAPASLNPYEIQRSIDSPTLDINNPAAGIENAVLIKEQQPTSLEIGLPFTPTIDCRINFKKLSLNQLSSSKLAAEMLSFSPVAVTPKRMLGAISEETTMDIGKELDCYQLELENSINEAKLRKVDKLVVTAAHTNKADKADKAESKPKHVPSAISTNKADPQKFQINEQNHEDVCYASDSEDENQLERVSSKFVRCYRPGPATINKETLPLPPSATDKTSKPSESKHIGVRHIIRNSLRKLTHNAKQQSQKSQKVHTNSSPEKPTMSVPANIISSIRYSLRRRGNKGAQQKEEDYAEASNVSIIDQSERTVKLRSYLPETEYLRIEQLTTEKKHTLRNSIRHSTRVLCHVFHKSEEYSTTK